MMELPYQTNTPFIVEYSIIVDAVEIISDYQNENIIDKVSFHVDSLCNDIQYSSETITCNFDNPDFNNFKSFQEFTKAEIVAILEKKCFEQILVIKSKLNSQYYVTKKVISSDDLSWS